MRYEELVKEKRVWYIKNNKKAVEVTGSLLRPLSAYGIPLAEQSLRFMDALSVYTKRTEKQA